MNAEEIVEVSRKIRSLANIELYGDYNLLLDARMNLVVDLYNIGKEVVSSRHRLNVIILKRKVLEAQNNMKYRNDGERANISQTKAFLDTKKLLEDEVKEEWFYRQLNNLYVAIQEGLNLIASAMRNVEKDYSLTNIKDNTNEDNTKSSY